MIGCDYNGWADVPESEREELEAFEASGRLCDASASFPLLMIESSAPARELRLLPAPAILEQKAA